MELDPKLLDKIKSMDEKELSAKISEISKLIGVNESLLKRTVGSPEQIRRKIGELSDEDIKRLSRNIDPNTLSKLKDNFEG